MYKPHDCTLEAAKYQSSVVQEKKIGEIQESTQMLIHMWDF